MSEGKNKRVGRVMAKSRTSDEKFGFGGIFSPFPGAYSLGLAVKDEDGTYDQIVAVKTAKGKKIDLNDYYLNLYVNEEMIPYQAD